MTLANAIVEQAAKDYRWATNALPKTQNAAAMRSETGGSVPHGWTADQSRWRVAVRKVGGNLHDGERIFQSGVV